MASKMPTMNSNDEDFNLFLDEFLHLLNKYHYVVKNKMCIMRVCSDLVVTGAQADGKFFLVGGAGQKNQAILSYQL